MVIIGTAITVLLVFGFPFLMRRHKDTRLIRLVLVAYVAIMLILTLGIRTYDQEVTINLKLFNGFVRIWFQLSNSFRKYGHKYDLQQFWLMRRGICNILLNVILFVPAGYLIPSALKGIERWWKTLLIGFCFTLTIECLQFITHRGWFDVDDLLHNSLGSMIGWLLNKRIVNRS